MRLATIRASVGTAAVRVETDTAVEIGADNLGTLLADHDWRERAATADGPRHELTTVDYAPPVPRPDKIVCVGLNYRTHIAEMGRDMPTCPTLFAKYPDALIGPYDDLVLPVESTEVDWEAELAVIIGAPVRHADRVTAAAAIAGYSVLNDVTMRDWQYRSSQWLQGKTFEATAPFGPYLVTADEVASDAEITCEVDGEVVQSSQISDLVFSPVDLVRYISKILTLRPGDVIATGTCGGVGHARTPRRYLAPGQKLVTRIAGVGELVNLVRKES